jgi:hypothetical protein
LAWRVLARRMTTRLFSKHSSNRVGHLSSGHLILIFNRKFEKRALLGRCPAAKVSSVKVSCDMAVMGLKRSVSLFKQTNLFRLRAPIRDCAG